MKMRGAILKLRGTYDPTRKVWLRTPKATTEKKVSRWMLELGLDPFVYMPVVKKFESVDQMDRWFREMEVKS